MPIRLIEFKEVGKFKKCPGGFCWVYCLKTLKKPSICLQGITPSAPSERSRIAGSYILIVGYYTPVWWAPLLQPWTLSSLLSRSARTSIVLTVVRITPWWPQRRILLCTKFLSLTSSLCCAHLLTAGVAVSFILMWAMLTMQAKPKRHLQKEVFKEVRERWESDIDMNQDLMEVDEEASKFGDDLEIEMSSFHGEDSRWSPDWSDNSREEEKADDKDNDLMDIDKL